MSFVTRSQTPDLRTHCAGNTSVGYLVLAAVVGLASVGAFNAFGTNMHASIGERAASTAVATPAMGGSAHGASDEGSSGVALQGEARSASASSATAGPAGPAYASQEIEYGETPDANQSSGGGGFGLATVAKLGFTALVGAATASAVVAGAPIWAGLGAASTTIWALSSWNDIHAPSLESFLGGVRSATSWIGDSFIGDALGAVSNAFTGNHFFGNTFSGVVGSAWSAFSTVVGGALSAVSSVVDTVFNAVETIGYGIYDVTGIDSKFFSEFNDYAGLWNYPLTSMFWEGTKWNASNVWKYLQRIGRSNRPGMAKAIGSIAASAEASQIVDVNSEEMDWPFETQVGDRVESIDQVLAEIGIDPENDAVVVDGMTVTYLENADGGTDMLVYAAQGSDEAGYTVRSFLVQEGSEEMIAIPLSATPGEIPADGVVEISGDEYEAMATPLLLQSYSVYASAVLGMDVDPSDPESFDALFVGEFGQRFRGSASEQTLSLEEEDGTQRFATIRMNDTTLDVAAAIVDPDQSSSKAAVVEQSNWHFEMVDDGYEGSVDDAPDAQFELINARATRETTLFGPART